MRAFKLGHLREEVYLCVFALLLGAAMTWYAYQLDLLKALTDQAAHLNFARLTFDSRTPGISQIGFWPPLLHLLLIPFVAFHFLYDTGLAGAFTLIPFLCLATVLLYRTCLVMTKNKLMSFSAGILFLLNPYTLYYASTPMMEVLFMAHLFGVAYCTASWLETSKLRHLVGMGAFMSLAALSRFEGLILLPIVGLIVLIRLVQQRKKYQEIEALVLLFSMVALIGVAFIMIYSWIFGGTPLAFSGGDWLRDPAVDFRLARHSVVLSLQYILHASFYMIGKPLVWLSFVLSVPVLLFARKRMMTTSVLLVLISPLLFVFMSMYMGSITVNVTELEPFGFFHNDRYCLTWVGFAIMAPILFIHLFTGRTRKESAQLPFSYHVAANGLLVLFALNLYHTFDVVYREKFDIIRKNINSPQPPQVEMAEYLKDHYDYGHILSGRVDNDPIFAEADVPLRNYIYEGNYRYFDQALREPWLFSRWVLMHANNGEDPWVAENEAIYRQWGTSDEFNYFYTLVKSNDTRQLYKLNTNIVIRLAEERGMNLDAIPSLNAKNWLPSTVYASMQQKDDSPVNTQKLLASKTLVHQQLLKFYEERLQPDYRRGYFTNSNREGNSESQSYALLQSVWADDKATFDTVWLWTKRNLQRPDGLFRWQFSMNGQQISIRDSNSATDADVDIAYALLLAGQQWEDSAYIEEARTIIRGFWNEETVESVAGRHVVAGNWAGESETVVMNPSYFSPHAYALFAEYEPSYDWDSLIQTGYNDIVNASEAMREARGAFLPPNWVQMNTRTEAIGPFETKTDSYDYSYDAFRTYWRVAMDYALHRNAAAKDYLESSTTFDDEMAENNRLCSVYAYSTKDVCQTNVGTLAGPLSLWTITDPDAAKTMLAERYLQTGNVELPEDSAFYEKSWYWFSLWLWSTTK